MVKQSAYACKTHGDGDMIDLSAAVENAIQESGVRSGLCHVFVEGSTAAITTIEYEPGLKKDLPRILERIAPRHENYEHNKTWGDENGYAHVRAALLGPGIVIPVSDGNPVLGQWQQPVLVECDNRARDRTIHFTVMGE
jgi:secondary thiamine-phosphate synthase enzyme